MTEGEERLLSELVVSHAYIFTLRQSVANLVGMVGDVLQEVSSLSGEDYSAELNDVQFAFVALDRCMGPGQESPDVMRQMIAAIRHVRQTETCAVAAAQRFRSLREVGLDDPQLAAGSFRQQLPN